ncbi:hypothetical protein [Cyanobium sp. Morenito 9A2]|uniref:hypothetical protein n=1 Tax=Cyanobium sp. Morenito 9A2 TaxID=2823718 RepID=UPI0020CF35B3|nr:hypothetical protein [Cyanobium sp. Morenito 9A2]MCP9848571.1 hypothetical protein [Cyanobium sp. Morenito 9A2]
MVALPFSPSTDSLLELPLLLAPQGQLSGDGQLLELFKERRDRPRHGDLWYLTPSAIAELGLGSADGQLEGVASSDAGVITWLHMRFGGTQRTVIALPERLKRWASQLPPAAPHIPLELRTSA